VVYHTGLWDWHYCQHPLRYRFSLFTTLPRFTGFLSRTLRAVWFSVNFGFYPPLPATTQVGLNTATHPAASGYAFGLWFASCAMNLVAGCDTTDVTFAYRAGSWFARARARCGLLDWFVTPLRCGLRAALHIHPHAQHSLTCGCCYLTATVAAATFTVYRNVYRLTVLLPVRMVPVAVCITRLFTRFTPVYTPHRLPCPVAWFPVCYRYHVPHRLRSPHAFTAHTFAFTTHFAFCSYCHAAVYLWFGLRCVCGSFTRLLRSRLRSCLVPVYTATFTHPHVYATLCVGLGLHHTLQLRLPTFGFYCLHVYVYVYAFTRFPAPRCSCTHRGFPLPVVRARFGLPFRLYAPLLHAGLFGLCRLVLPDR